MNKCSMMKLAKDVNVILHDYPTPRMTFEACAAVSAIVVVSNMFVAVKQQCYSKMLSK